jgi:hypothetical protein
MQLVGEKPARRPYQPYIVEEVEVDEAEFAGEPVIIPELPERPPEELGRRRPDRRRDDNGNAAETDPALPEPPPLDWPEPEDLDAAESETDEPDLVESDVTGPEAFEPATPAATNVETSESSEAPADRPSANGNGQSQPNPQPGGHPKGPKPPRKKRGGRRRGRGKGRSGDSA